MFSFHFWLMFLMNPNFAKNMEPRKFKIDRSFLWFSPIAYPLSNKYPSNILFLFLFLSKIASEN